MLIDELQEKLAFFKQVASNYRGDDVETEYTRGQNKALLLVISHLEPIVQREVDNQIDDLFGDGSQFKGRTFHDT